MQLARRIAVLLSVALFLALAGTASAYEEIKGEAMVESVDLEEKTLVIDGLTFEITTRTVLTGLEGQRITLAELDPPPLAKGGLTNLNMQPNVRYEGAEIRGKRLLISATRVEGFER